MSDCRIPLLSLGIKTKLAQPDLETSIAQGSNNSSPTPTSAVPFAFTDHVKRFMQDHLRHILAKGNVDAYTRTMSIVDSAPIRRTPLLLLKAHVQSQDPLFHRDYLPPGYPTDIGASCKVVELMKRLLKSEKGLLRNLLLTNIRAQKDRLISGAVPCLDDLVVCIDRYMAARKQLRAVEVILRSYPSTTRTRLAFLRLYIVDHLIHRDPADNTSHWELVDQQLEYVRGQSKLYRIAYGRVVKAIDWELFGQKRKFEEIPHNDIRVPTEDDVQEQIALMSAGGGSVPLENAFN
ncbi:uncharacterized protein PGTG_01081 [Puccinia graminis f. sp. tritici CRL 75-36-700-3]|uniref:Uncharacterized protein n=1 Tax=Puccinia graminis f. sp. tritici (strain CRL 75-36-700-3 / race SCCL) TaxID=418459 RepID=E3JUM5_PUCGT|nr:uncharacterized protein PGTG_01081 [Puccinia graminis f. sp. tritici CRL 75-36-700-3]EFP75750.1 hypothetical protein PGTG_01081 [Puccinia graminis f. sp. tritici CRL 75-36-700-3]